MPNTFKNLQAAARRRGLSLHKSNDGFEMRDPRFGKSKPMTFEDLAEVRDELRSREVDGNGLPVPTPGPITEKEYALVLESAARVLLDKEEAERTGRKPLYDIDTAFDDILGTTILDTPTPCGKTLGECTTEDLDVNVAAYTLVDYLMVQGELLTLKAKKTKQAA